MSAEGASPGKKNSIAVTAAARRNTNHINAELMRDGPCRKTQYGGSASRCSALNLVEQPEQSRHPRRSIRNQTLMHRQRRNAMSPVRYSKRTSADKPPRDLFEVLQLIFELIVQHRGPLSGSACAGSKYVVTGHTRLHATVHG